MPVRRPWQPRPEPPDRDARKLRVPALAVTRRACAAGLILAVATAGSLTGIITSNHHRGIAQAAAVPAAASTTDPSSTKASTGAGAVSAATLSGAIVPGSTTAAAGLPVVASSTPDSQGQPGVVPVPLAPRAVAGPIPTLAWQAYHYAAAGSGCNLPWYLLAGIGKIESNHGRFGGARFDIAGTVHPAIYGPPTAYGRAMGPMQFIPPTWASYAVDGNGDGRADPQNVFDATAAAAHYLCRAGGSDLSGAAAQRRAVFAYNHLDSYVADVLAFAAAYSQGASEATVPIVPIAYPKSTAKASPTTARPTAVTTSSPSHPRGTTTSTAATTPAKSGPATKTTATTTATTSAAPTTTGSPAPTCTTPPTTSAAARASTAAPRSKNTSTTSPTTTAAATANSPKTSARTTTARSTSATVKVPKMSTSSACAPCPTATTSSPRTTPAMATTAPTGCAVPTSSAAKTSVTKASATKASAAKAPAAQGASATAKVMATLSSKIVPLAPATSIR